MAKSMTKKSAKAIVSKRGIAKKVIIAILLIIFIGALATSVTFNYLMYDKYIAAANKPDTPNDPEDPDDPNHSFVVTPIDTEFMSITPMLLTLDTGEEHVVRLTATVSPENATDKTVDWTIAFENPQSSWAEEKNVTDYVTVTPTANGALTADVQGLQAFQEKIIVTATSRVNAKATASCVIDYATRYNNIDPTLNKEDGTMSYSFDSTPGTIDDSKFVISIGLNPEFSSVFLAKLQTANGDIIVDPERNITLADCVDAIQSCWTASNEYFTQYIDGTFAEFDLSNGAVLYTLMPFCVKSGRITLDTSKTEFTLKLFGLDSLDITPENASDELLSNLNTLFGLSLSEISKPQNAFVIQCKIVSQYYEGASQSKDMIPISPLFNIKTTDITLNNLSIVF